MINRKTTIRKKNTTADAAGKGREMHDSNQKLLATKIMEKATSADRYGVYFMPPL
jgi:hypothetical protein